jgi:hypothetical protein
MLGNRPLADYSMLAPTAGAMACMTVLLGCHKGSPDGHQTYSAAIGSPGKVADCVRDVSSRNAASDAQRDIARKEFRFFGSISPENTGATAPGLECTAPDFTRPSFLDKYGVRQASDEDGVKCRLAIYNYEAQYNRAMATMHSKSLMDYCNPEPLTADPTYRASHIGGISNTE